MCLLKKMSPEEEEEEGCKECSLYCSLPAIVNIELKSY